MIEKVQRRATKLLPDLNNLPYDDRLKALNLPTLKYRRLRADLLYIYKLTHNLVEMDQDTHCLKCTHNTQMLQKSLRPSNRGHQHKYQIHHHPGIRHRFRTWPSAVEYSLYYNFTQSWPTLTRTCIYFCAVFIAARYCRYSS